MALKQNKQTMGNDTQLEDTSSQYLASIKHFKYKKNKSTSRLKEWPTSSVRPPWQSGHLSPRSVHFCHRNVIFIKHYNTHSTMIFLQWKFNSVLNWNVLSNNSSYSFVSVA